MGVDDREGWVEVEQGHHCQRAQHGAALAHPARAARRPSQGKRGVSPRPRTVISHLSLDIHPLSRFPLPLPPIYPSLLPASEAATAMAAKRLQKNIFSKPSPPPAAASSGQSLALSSSTPIPSPPLPRSLSPPPTCEDLRAEAWSSTGPVPMARLVDNERDDA